MSTSWTETHRAIVFPWNCDNYGHMNVRFYFDHFDDSSFHSWAALDLPRTLLTCEGVEAVTARNTVKYFSELSAGELFTISVSLIRIGNKSVTFRHKMVNSATGDLCATMDTVEVMFNPQTRQSAEMPHALRVRLNEKLDSEVEAKEQKPNPQEESKEPRKGQWHETHRSLVFPWRCDHFGHMNARWYAHHFDDAGFHLFCMAGVNVASLLSSNVALVTAQTEINYVQEMRPGTLFVVRSGFSHVGSKSARHLHRMYNAETGELHATMEAVDVAFDMASRKSIAIPDESRKSLVNNLVDVGA